MLIPKNLIPCLVTAAVLAVLPREAFAGKIQKSRDKLEKNGGNGKSGSGTSSLTDDDDDDECDFLPYLFGLCGGQKAVEEEDPDPADVRMQGRPSDPPAEAEVVEPVGAEGSKSAFEGIARVELLHGKTESDRWTQFGLELGFGDEKGAVFVSAEGMEIREVDEKGVTLDKAGIIPFSLGVQLGDPHHKLTVGWGWAFTDGLADAEGRFWRLQLELIPLPHAFVSPFLRTSMRGIWFRDVFFHNLRADFALLIARRLEVFVGGSRASLEEIDWNWLHFGAAVRL